RFDHILADAAGARGEEGPGVLADQIAQPARQNQEIDPLQLQLVLFAEAFGLLGSLLLLREGTGRHGSQTQQQKDLHRAFHAALRRRMDSVIWSARASLSAARLLLAAASSSARRALASRTAASILWRAASRSAVSRSCNCLCDCSCAW